MKTQTPGLFDRTKVLLSLIGLALIAISLFILIFGALPFYVDGPHALRAAIASLAIVAFYGFCLLYGIQMVCRELADSMSLHLGKKIA